MLTKQIVLISCVSKKPPLKPKVQDLYISSLFKKNLQFACKLGPDYIFILSAKCGLLELNDIIDTCDVTLNAIKLSEIKDLSNMVLSQLKRKTDIDNDEFVFLAGDRYRKRLLPHIKHFQIPMQGLKIGKQLQSLRFSLCKG